MATLPCFNSDSLNLWNSTRPGGERSRGSKKPKGPDTPASSLGLKAGAAGVGAGGRITESITWITPLSVTISVFTTLAPFTLTPAALTVTSTFNKV